MRARVLWRKVHYWLSVVVALPLLLVISTGLLLHVKKDFHWIQPEELRGTDGAPGVSFDEILARCAEIPELAVERWEDVQQVDYRPGKSLVKVTAKNGWEAQLDPADGRVLQVAFRRSDVIEALHDGAWFGDVAKRWVFLPSGVVLLVLLATGIYLFLLPFLARRKRPSR
jgi:uncharacterized iron-regulated membrane protein